MAQGNRNKEFWLIPKRANLHQSVVIIKGILELNYDKKSWNSSKQDRLGSYLGSNGATNNGRTITPQSIRTLVASIPQYFGFAYINRNTTPNSIVVTDAGYHLVNEFENFLEEYNYSKLSEAEKDNGEIKFSSYYLNQFCKIQITNPIILKDCENIFVFPLIFILTVIQQTEYLTFDEIGYFIFKVKNQDEVDLVSLEIHNFRKINYKDMKNLIDEYKNTHLGNISLVQAPTVSYFKKLLSYTNLFEFKKIIIPNPNNTDSTSINCICLVKEKENEINSIISKYNNETFDFVDNLDLWIEYIGNTNIIKTPQKVCIKNKIEEDLLITITDSNNLINGDLIKFDDEIFFPCVENHIYNVNIYDIKTSELVHKIEYVFSDNPNILIENISIQTQPIQNISDIQKQIINHIKSRYFSEDYLQFLQLLEKIYNKELSKNKNLRGGRLEYLLFLLFTILENNSIVDDVIWNGKVGKCGLPTPAPGGVKGSPDLLIYLDDIILVIECTTIKPKSSQWSSEGSSVPDHIKIVEKDNKSKKVIGLYLAPIIHKRVSDAMISNLSDSKSELINLDIESFIQSISSLKSKKEMILYLLGYLK